MTAPTTNWEQYGLADIWDMVKLDDGTANAGHIRSWAVMNELCDEQATRLNAAATELAQHWPPDQSPAADIFIQRLKGMALVFTEAARAAGGNSIAIQILTMALLDTRGRIKTLRETWRHWEGQEAVRVAKTRELLHPVLPVVSSLRDADVLMASNVDPAKTLVDLAGAPKVATNWRQELDRSAREVMRASDKELTETRTQLKQPPVLDSHSDTATAWPPVLPPRTSGGGGASGSPGSFGGTGSGAEIAPLAFAPPAGEPGRSPWSSDNQFSDPMLAGGVGDRGPMADVPSWRTPDGQPPSTLPLIATPGGMAMAPGGVIGIRPPSPPGSASPSGPVTGRAGPLATTAPGRTRLGTTKSPGGGFVAPPGGMIGGRPTGGADSRVSGAVAGRRRRRNDPDDDWTVAEGVPSMLEPETEPVAHDPGPGVFGIDR